MYPTNKKKRCLPPLRLPPLRQLSPLQNRLLALTSLSFAVGFLLTNISFSSSSAPFTETIKAAEPLSSALLAAFYRVEDITLGKGTSLLLIVAGVVLMRDGAATTNGDLILSSPIKAAGAGTGTGTGAEAGAGTAHGFAHPTLILPIMLILASNVCFSFRGLHQTRLKLKILERGGEDVKSTTLLYRMVHFGAIILFPLFLLYSLVTTFTSGTPFGRSFTSPLDFVKMVFILGVNGTAFAAYNGASTTVLQRVRFIDHAALNCIRRAFAIACTAFLFKVTFTLQNGLGILFILIGFGMYQVFKGQQRASARNKKEDGAAGRSLWL